ncbi:MAG: BlaI/MecI/CopY family transcriptional regulator [Lachnospiraceae bacterium]|nr:BlaI/MecI/CopY family transcriptional regulator [Lachnospiraceae bacterium]
MKLTNNEISILHVLWNQNRPLSATEIVQFCKDKQWKSASIHLLVNSLLEKKAIQVAGFEKVGKTYCRTFAPVFSRAEFTIQSFTEDFDPDDDFIRDVGAALIQKQTISSQTLDYLQDLINKARSQTN